MDLKEGAIYSIHSKTKKTDILKAEQALKEQQEMEKKDGIYISVSGLTNEKKEKLVYLCKLTEAGKLKTVIDRRS